MGRLAGTILILLGVHGAVDLVSLPVLVSLHSKAQKFLAGTITQATFDHAVKTYNSVTGLQSGAQVALAVIVVIWMRRLAVNHRAFGRPNTRFGPGWAIGGWLVPPGVGYVVPWRMFTELWKGSDPTCAPSDEAWKANPATPLLALWWVLYGVAIPVLQILGSGLSIQLSSSSSSVSTSNDTAKILTHNFWAQLGAPVLLAVTAAVFAKIVIDLTARQKALTGES